LTGALVADLREVVGDANVLTAVEDTAGYTCDWTGRFQGLTPAVARPASTAEVAGVVAACRRHGVPLVPQGGNTGLVGGGVPLAGEVVLSLSRLAGVESVDPAARRLVALAGTPLAAVEAAAAAHGLAYGVDLGARGSATIGGTVATNAGGLRFVRHGGTREQLAGIEAVLGNGSTVAHLGAPAKDNTGYDLAALLCGSEGTLGVVTRACLRLVPRHDERAVSLLGFATPEAALAAAAALSASMLPLDALEMIWGPTMALLARELPPGPPFDAAAYLLVECADLVDPLPALSAAVDSLAGVVGAAVATDGRRRAELWRYRDEIAPAIARVGVPVKMDVSVPLPAQRELAASVSAVVTGVAPGAGLYLFGHVGDGNLHVNVVLPASAERDVAHRVEDAVYRVTADLGGSISAEHGIGTAKLPWLGLVRSDAELAAFRAIKSALDPDSICNPHCLLPPPFTR
jgi:FAD/FMN-containing dehydrogenase